MFGEANIDKIYLLCAFPQIAMMSNYLLAADIAERFPKQIDNWWGSGQELAQNIINQQMMNIFLPDFWHKLKIKIPSNLYQENAP